MNSKKVASSEGSSRQMVPCREIPTPAGMPADRLPRFIRTALGQVKALRGVMSGRSLTTILIAIILIVLILRGIEIRISDIRIRF